MNSCPTPAFPGPRVQITTLFAYLDNGELLDDVLEAFPTASRVLAIQVLEVSKALRRARD